MRPYYNHDDESDSRQVRFSFGSTSTVKALIAVNALAYLATVVAAKGYPNADLWVGFYPPNFLHHYAWWQPISYMFVHGGLWHLLLNMFGLFIFAGAVEREIGRARFLVMYFLCGIAGAALSFFAPNTAIIGASGGVLGVTTAFAVLFPNERIWMFLVVAVRARYFAIFYVFVTVAGLLGAGGYQTAYWAHLGGIAVGFLFVVSRPWFERLGGFLRFRREQARERRSASEEAELDRILDKVHREGITALSNSEREFLNLVSKRRR